jgi:hypothetical protein
MKVASMPDARVQMHTTVAATPAAVCVASVTMKSSLQSFPLTNLSEYVPAPPRLKQQSGRLELTAATILL